MKKLMDDKLIEMKHLVKDNPVFHKFIKDNIGDPGYMTMMYLNKDDDDGDPVIATVTNLEFDPNGFIIGWTHLLCTADLDNNQEVAEFVVTKFNMVLGDRLGIDYMEFAEAMNENRLN